MEIHIDFELVRGLLRDEYRRAREDIVREGPARALELSQQRHDARLAAASDAQTLACAAGCSWCCHFTVDVRSAEVVRILDAMDTLDPAERDRATREIAQNAAALAGLDEEQRMLRNVKCPFLSEAGRCVIYSARPQTCRNYHATDATGCKQSFEQPGNLEIDPDFAPIVYQSGAAHVDAFSKALEDEGYCSRIHELSTAMFAALADPQGTRARFAAKQWPLLHLTGDEAPYEFAEDIEEMRRTLPVR